MLLNPQHNFLAVLLLATVVAMRRAYGTGVALATRCAAAVARREP